MSECSHPAVFHSMCVSCGKVIEAASNGAKLTISGGKVLQLSAQEAEQVQISKIEHLKKSRKLALVLDLDHTLLHAVQIEGPTPSQSSIADLHHLPIEELINGTVKHLVMKKRPYLDQFLAQAHEFCQMTVYTAGTRRYAEAVVKVLDPHNKYINGRVVSRSDDTSLTLSKSLSKIFLNDSSMAVILDDREDVWKGFSAQLLLVRPYMYFHSSVEVNNAPGMQSSQANSQSQAPCPVISLQQPGKLLRMAPQASTDYSEADDQLPRCLELLRQIHAQYYGSTPSPSDNTADSIGDMNSVVGAVDTASSTSSLPLPSPSHSVSSILGVIRTSVLTGCVVTFSGIIPTNAPRPETHFLYQLALQLGAVVTLSPSARVTHLICVSTQTRKVQALLAAAAAGNGTGRKELYVLHPDWLIYSKWAMARAQEETFSLLASNNSQNNSSNSSTNGAVQEAAIEPAVVPPNLTIPVPAPRQNNATLTPSTKKRRLQEIIAEKQAEKRTRPSIPTSDSHESLVVPLAAIIPQDMDEQEEEGLVRVPVKLYVELTSSDEDEDVDSEESEERDADGDGDCKAFYEHDLAERYEESDDEADGDGEGEEALPLDMQQRMGSEDDSDESDENFEDVILARIHSPGLSIAAQRAGQGSGRAGLAGSKSSSSLFDEEDEADE